MFLAINTSFKKSFVMIIKDNQVLDIDKWDSNNNQSEELLFRIQKLFDKNNIKDIKGIIVINGPGSYTGIRVGVATANSLGYALGVKVTSINYLELLAKLGFSENSDVEKIIVVQESIYDKYYYGIFRKNIDQVEYGNKEINEINPEGSLIIGDISLNNALNIDYFNDQVVDFLSNIAGNIFNESGDSDVVDPFYINKPNITISDK